MKSENLCCGNLVSSNDHYGSVANPLISPKQSQSRYLILAKEMCKGAINELATDELTLFISSLKEEINDYLNSLIDTNLQNIKFLEEDIKRFSGSIKDLEQLKSQI